MRHEFVEYIPKELQPDTVYVSVQNETVVHNCFCGCGDRVVTPLSPTDWKLTFDGQSISLYPSVGNWNLACQSHYWIRNGVIVWAEQWSEDEVRSGYLHSQERKQEYFSKRNAPGDVDINNSSVSKVKSDKSWLKQIFETIKFRK